MQKLGEQEGIEIIFGAIYCLATLGLRHFSTLTAASQLRGQVLPARAFSLSVFHQPALALLNVFV